MANYVRSRFHLIGNDAVKKYSEELQKKLTKDVKENSNLEDLSAVGRIIYGLKGDDAYLGLNEIGAKWVMINRDIIDEGIAFVSGWEPPNLLQNHLLKDIVKLDPQAIVLMEYEDEAPNFVGVRYVVMNEGQISEQEFRADLTDYIFVDEEEYEEAVAENNLTDEYEMVITGYHIKDMLVEQRELAFEFIQKENKWIKDEIFQTSSF